jgi:hypothetical protein
MILSLAAAFSGAAVLTGLWYSVRGTSPGLWTFFAESGPGRALPEPTPGTPPPLPPGWSAYGGARPEIRGWPNGSVLAVRGLAKQPPEVLRVLVEVCEQLGTPVDTVAAVLAHESGWNPTALYFRDKNDDGSPRKVPFVAAGLCQLTVEAHLDGFGDWEKVRAVTTWPAERQLREVLLPLWSKYGKRVRGAHPGHGLMLNFLPDRAGGPEDKVLGDKDAPGLLGRVYAINRGLDLNGDGKITIADVYASAARVCRGAKGRRVRLDGSIWTPPEGSRVVVAPRPAPVRPALAPSPTEVKPQGEATAPGKADAPSNVDAASKADAPSKAATPNKAEPAKSVAPTKAAPSASAAPPDKATSPKETSTPEPMAAPENASTPGEKVSMPENASTAQETTAPSTSTTSPRVEPLTSPAAPPSPASSSSKPLRLGSSAGGLLLAAIRGGREETPIWAEVPWEGRGKTAGVKLVVRVSAHAVRAPVEVEGLGKRLLRLPISYQEQIEVCRLRKWFPLTQSISDAVWFAARRLDPPLLGKWGTAEEAADSSRRMRTLEWVVQFNDQLDRQIPTEASHRLWATEGKDWILHPRLLERTDGMGAINYGLHRRDGVPWQSPGGKHNWAHYDYSQVLRAMEWEGTDPATGKKVPVIEVLRKVGVPAALLAPFERIG